MARHCFFCDKKHFSYNRLDCGCDDEGICDGCSYVVYLHQKHNTDVYNVQRCPKCNQKYHVKFQNDSETNVSKMVPNTNIESYETRFLQAVEDYNRFHWPSKEDFEED